jgi:iron complex outermembrane receptor protein
MHAFRWISSRLCRGLAVSVLCFVPGRVIAQSATGTVEGTVQHAVSGDFLNNARVAVPGGATEAFTDGEGRFRLAGLPAGPITLRVSYTGLDAEEAAMTVAPGGVVRRDFRLGSRARYGAAADAVVLDQFLVEASREMNAAALAINEQRYAPNIKNVIAADAFGDVSEGNVGEFMKRLPGVSIDEAAGDSYGVSLRGFAPEFTPITIDGNSVPSASFSASSVSRGNNLEQISMSNVARLEVIKSPVPSVAADALGGSVNLISKSSFERTRPELTVRGTLQFTAEDYRWSRTPGPGSPPSRKLRPGYELSYINPVSRNFGFTLSSLLSDQFGKILGPIRTFEFAPAQGGSLAAPYLRQVRTTDDARETTRQSFAGGVDWRPVEGLTLSAGLRHTLYDLFTAPQRITFNTGNNPVASGAEFTRGRTGAGSIVHQQIWTTKFGNTDQFTLSGRYRRGAWRADFSGSYADSGNKYRDVEQGFFRGATTRMIAPALTYEGIGAAPDFPASVTARTIAGAVLDWTRLQNYELVGVPSVQRDASDTITSLQGNVRREFSWRRVHGAAQTGFSYRKRTVDRGATSVTWNFVGADGVAGTADDNAGAYVDSSYLGVDLKYGEPGRIEWPDLRALYRLYQERPSYFVLPAAAQASAYTFEATNSERISEEIAAAYLQGELRLLGGRLPVLGGVRFERTENVGIGLLRDRDAVYLRDAAGRIVRAANGTPVFATNDVVERARLEYRRRALRAGRTYDGFYPSVNASYQILPNLQLRASYARTLGRPNFNFVVPNFDVIEDLATDGADGLVVARNPALKPWTADNFDVALEYYFQSGGVASAGIFRKNITDGFGTNTVVLDDALLAQFELDRAYRGWDLQTTFNIGQAIRIEGVEFSYQQPLTFLPAFARGVSVYGNATLLELEGPAAATPELYEKTGNWGVSYSRGRFGLGLNWNYRGSRSTTSSTYGVGGQTLTRSRITLDVNSEFRFSRRLSLFLNARNLTNSRLYQDGFGDLTPAYSHQRQGPDYGAKLSAGVRGRF